MDGADEVVMYVVARKDLKMSAGKLAAQGMHGLQYVLESFDSREEARLYDNWMEDGEDQEFPDDVRWRQEWKRGDHAKIVLAVDSLAELEALEEKIGHRARTVVDRGRTEVAPNTKTATCLLPMPRSLAAVWVGQLRPYPRH